MESTEEQPISLTLRAQSLRVIAALLALFALLIIAAWCAGLILTDRYAWSQWLWWMPTPLAIAAAVVGLLLALRCDRRGARRLRRAIMWGLAFGLITAWFAFIEHRFFFTPIDTSEGLVIAHWNMSHPLPREYDDYASAAIRLAEHSDVLILSSPSVITARREVLDGIAEGKRVHRLGTFSVVSGLEIISARPLVNREGIWSMVVELDANEALGRPIVLYIVDLPAIDLQSRRWMLQESRYRLAMRFGELIAQTDAPPPDIVVGDFNITRSSASLAALFPSLHHAYDDGGHGYGATFHRAWPYAHIDHILLRKDLFAVRYDIVDPGLSRHRAQIARITRAPSN